MFRTGGNAGFGRQDRASGEVRPTAPGVLGVSVHGKFRVPFGPAHRPMNRRVVGSAGIPAGVLRADCHAGKDAGAPRFMEERESFVFPPGLRVSGHNAGPTRAAGCGGGVGSSPAIWVAMLSSPRQSSSRNGFAASADQAANFCFGLS